jgi:hypothetical protein
MSPMPDSLNVIISDITTKKLKCFHYILILESFPKPATSRRQTLPDSCLH